MNPWQRLPCACGAALLMAAGTPSADTTLEMDMTAGGKLKQTIQVSNGHVRITTAEQGGNFVILYREGVDEYRVLDTRSKTVMTITPRQVQQASGMMKQMQAMMAEQMKNMTPQERAQLEGMMGKPGAADSRTKPVIRMTKRTEMVQSWRCDVVEVVEGAQVISEVCVAKAKTLGIPERDFQTMQGFFKLMSSMAESAGEGMGKGVPDFGPGEMPGVPVRASHFDQGKKDIVQLSRVSTDRLDGALFQVPKDFKPTQFPAMPMQ